MSWSYTSAIFAEQQSPSASTKQTVFAPTIHHPNIKDVTLFAQNPQIVTPVGIAVAPDGRVFVQENHTHKRTKEYAGPKTDRILIFEDTTGDGIADKRTVFHEDSHSVLIFYLDPMAISTSVPVRSSAVFWMRQQSKKLMLLRKESLPVKPMVNIRTMELEVSPLIRPHQNGWRLVSVKILVLITHLLAVMG